MRSIAPSLVCTILLMTSFIFAADRLPNDKPFWTAGLKDSEFAKIQNERLANAQAALDRMLAVKGKRTVDNTLVPYNDAMIYLDAAGSEAGLMQQVHPEKGYRATAEKLAQKISAFAINPRSAARPSSVARSAKLDSLPRPVSMVSHGMAGRFGLVTSITSAPCAASVRPATGPAITRDRSSTRRPASGRSPAGHGRGSASPILLI